MTLRMTTTRTLKDGTLINTTNMTKKDKTDLLIEDLQKHLLSPIDKKLDRLVLMEEQGGRMNHAEIKELDRLRQMYTVVEAVKVTLDNRQKLIDWMVNYFTGQKAVLEVILGHIEAKNTKGLAKDAKFLKQGIEEMLDYVNKGII